MTAPDYLENDLQAMERDIIAFANERRMILEASDNVLATVVQTDVQTNTRKCKCAFCKADLLPNEGHAINGFRVTRYLCDNCNTPFIEKLYASVLMHEKELVQG